MKLAVLALLLPCVGCGGGSEPSEAVTDSPPLPRTVDKGDGCTVEITKDGTGPVARIGDEVTLTYVARVEASGSEDVPPPFASTDGWDAPLRIRVGGTGVLPGLSRGIEGLAAGAAARIEVPPALAYGAEGNAAAGVPAEATVVFEVEILGVAPR